MLSNYLGYYSLIFGFCLSLPIMFFSVKNFRDEKVLDYKILTFSFIQFILVLISFFGLMLSFIFSDFTNETVFNNSHTTLPLFYKIAGTWGNHEGSLLLWLLVLTLFIFLFLIKSKKEDKKYKILTLLFHQVIIIGFFIFLIKTSNPFNFLIPPPNEGLGLNPILQDPLLVIHPPVLYLGYVGSSIIFSSVLAATTLGNINNAWAFHIKSWIVVSWIFLTFGILLGSIWAYYELGWGGFWFWDPVENISLMPWLALTILMHCNLVLEKRSLLSSWVIILSIATFTLSMCGTFLVRSGILNSVHTFANDPARGLYILTFLFVLIFISIVIFFIFHKTKKKESIQFFLFSKETSILINNWFMMYFLSVVLIGTVYPIFLDVISSQKISIGPPFYHKLIIPFLIPFLIFMALGPKMKWIKSEIRNKFYLLFYFVISFIISFLIIKKFDQNFLINTVLVGSSLFLLVITIRDFLIEKKRNLNQNISHFGFSLLILSILMNNIFSSEVITNLKVGETFQNNKVKIIFKDLNQDYKENYILFRGNFLIKEKNQERTLFPELRVYNQPNIATSEADIDVNIFSDRFITMNVVQNKEYFNIRYQIKPLMLWIWISVIIISFGGILSLLRNNYVKITK